MAYYLMRGSIIINNYPTYADALQSRKSYPGSKILKDTYDENIHGAPKAYPWPDKDSITDEDYKNEQG